MKSTLMLYSFFIILFLINAVLSYSSNKVRLNEILRKSMNKKDSPFLLGIKLRTPLRAETISSAIDDKSSLVENEEPTRIYGRDSWDSGEDHYFKWASRNRRPMESLSGRKRSSDPIITGPRYGRINGGIWRSGLVG